MFPLFGIITKETNILKNSTLLRAFFALLAGILIVPIAGNYCLATLNIIFICWLILTIILLIFASRFSFAENLFSTSVIAGCFFLGYLLTADPINKINFPNKFKANVSGIVDSEINWQESRFGFNTNSEYCGTFILRINKVKLKNKILSNVNQRVRCTIVNTVPLKIERGDLINATGKYRKYLPATNPGEFDIAEYFSVKGITYKFIANSGILKWQNPPKTSLFLKLRRKLDDLRNTFAKILSLNDGYETETGILRRMILGTKEILPEKLTELLQRTNTFHIIAISGLHIGIVCGIWWCFMWLAGVPWKYRGLALLPVLWLYATMVGLRASVVRASFMFSALAIAPLIKRPHSAAQALLVAGFFYLLLWPKEIASMGTQLTFLAVAALLSIAYLFNKFLERVELVRGPAVYDIEHLRKRYFYTGLRYFLQIASATVAIWLITWPITLTRSNLITPSSWLANLCVVPAIGIILGLGIATLAVYFISPAFAMIINHLNLYLLHLLLKLVNYVGKIPMAYFSAKVLSSWEIFLYYSAITVTFVWALSVLKRKKHFAVRFAGAAACLIWLLFFVSIKSHKNPDENFFRVVTLDVGLGDASVIHLPSGETILIDGGVRYGPWSMGSRVVVPYLRSAGVNELDAIICSHFDRDHVGGIVDVLKMMKVRLIFSPPELYDNPLANQLKQIAKEKNIEWRELFAGDKLCWNSVTATVINPPAVTTNYPSLAAEWGGNPWSIVTRWEWNGRSFLTTGDSTIASEAIEIANGYKVKSDVLKAGHHGSSSSSSEKFLQAVKPAVTLISVGPNSLGLPTRKVMKRLKEESKITVSTERHGAIMTIFKPKEIEIKTF